MNIESILPYKVPKKPASEVSTLDAAAARILMPKQKDERLIEGLGLDFHEHLDGRLDYLRDFYCAITKPFVEQKRLIEANQAPWIDIRNPEDCDGPAFELEWLEADDYLRTAGFLCLGHLNSLMVNYVRMFVMREFNYQRVSQFQAWIGKVVKRVHPFNTPAPKGTLMQWLWCLETLSHPRFSWQSSPVNSQAIEDITLSRNTFEHDEQLLSPYVLQNREHFKTHHHSAFADTRWISSFGGEEYWNEPQPMRVSSESFLSAIETVREFCAFLETCRTNWNYEPLY